MWKVEASGKVEQHTPYLDVPLTELESVASRSPKGRVGEDVSLGVRGFMSFIAAVRLSLLLNSFLLLLVLSTFLITGAPRVLLGRRYGV